MTRPIVVDASAAVEILTSTTRGKRLAELIPSSAELWVPAHFYAEVLGAIRHLHIVSRKISLGVAERAISRMTRWHLRQAAIANLVEPAWNYRHNIPAGDAIYVALTQAIDGSLLTDDHRLAETPTFPKHVPIIRLPIQRAGDKE